MDKSQLRRHMRMTRQNIPREHSKRANDQVASQLKTEVDWQHVRTLHTYTSHEAWNEVSTDWLPHFINSNNLKVQITYGEPLLSASIPVRSYDVILVPLLAFDADCNRLGFGGGWYDRFLAAQPQALKIGLAFEAQRVARIPVEAHDIPLDMVVTESRIYTPTQKRSV